MIGLDSNVIVRYMTQDDAVQSPIATRTFEAFTFEKPGFVSIVTLIETVWVLRSFYDASGKQIQTAVEKLLRSRGVIVERSDVVWVALGGYAGGNAELADYLIERLGRAAGCDYTLTFDREAANTAGMRLLK